MWTNKLLCRICGFIFIYLVFSIIMDTGNSIGQLKDMEHPIDSKKRLMIESKFYWFYEAMGKLEDIKLDNDHVEGTYQERMRPTYFTIKKEDLYDPVARTEGYKMAIQKIIGYMESGAVPDTESNRKYMAELRAKLKEITGLNLDDNEEWKKWFDKKGPYLKWSNEKNLLVEQEVR